jgi:uncharacterized protein YbbK (DUF523 family)
LTARDSSRVRIGISSCLLGEKVRFDGGHKKDEFLTSHFGRYVEWVPVCPEFEIGLGVPRESLRLVADGKNVRLVAPRSGLDHTERMNNWTKEQTRHLVDQGLCGCVLKRSSPSCGLERVKVYSGSGLLNREGRGLFASGLVDRFPNLFSEQLAPDDRAELSEVIDRYRRDRLPLIVPVTFDSALRTQAQRRIPAGPDLSGSAPRRAELIEPTLTPIRGLRG